MPHLLDRANDGAEAGCVGPIHRAQWFTDEPGRADCADHLGFGEGESMTSVTWSPASTRGTSRRAYPSVLSRSST